MEMVAMNTAMLKQAGSVKEVLHQIETTVIKNLNQL
jgi:hypothetical protein